MRIEDTNCVNYYAKVTMETDCTTASGYLEVLDAFERCFGSIDGNTPCEFQSIKTVSSRPDILTLGGDVYLTRYYVYNDDRAIATVKIWLSSIGRVIEKAIMGTSVVSVSDDTSGEEVKKYKTCFRDVAASSDSQIPLEGIIDTSSEIERTKRFDFVVGELAVGLMDRLDYYNLSFEGSKYTSFYNLADIAVIPLIRK